MVTEKSEKEKVLFFSLIFIVLLLGIFIRCYMWINHFGTCDDLGVAASMLKNEAGGWSIKNCAKGFKSMITWGWTYAPLQFCLTSLLLSTKESYQQIVVLGRLPSFLCSSLTIVLFAFYLVKNSKKSLTDAILVILGIALISFSYENILFAGQMECYAITPLGSVVILLLFMKSKEKFWSWNWIFLTLLCYAQWQFFYIVFAFFMVFFFDSVFRKKDLKVILVSGIITLLLNIPNLLHFFKFGMLARGAREWNVGPNLEYLFKPMLHNESFCSLILYVFNFVTENILKIYKILFTHIDFSNTLSSILAIIFIILTVIGIIRLHMESMKFAFFIDCILFIVSILVIFEKLTLSPSRHVLIYQPFIIVCILSGIKFLSEKIRVKYVISVLTSIILIFEILGFCVELSTQMKIRKNHYSEEYLSQIVSKYNPDLILACGYSNTMNLFLSNQNGYAKKIENNLYFGFMIKENIESIDKIVLFSCDINNEELKRNYDKNLKQYNSDLSAFVLKDSVIREYEAADQEYCFSKVKFDGGDKFDLHEKARE